MYKGLGYLLGIIAAGIVAGVAIIALEINEMFSMGIGFFVAVPIFRYFNSLQKNAERSKFTTDDYFEDYKTNALRFRTNGIGLQWKIDGKRYI